MSSGVQRRKEASVRARAAPAFRAAASDEAPGDALDGPPPRGRGSKRYRRNIPSATRSELAISVNVGFTAPMEGKKLASAR